MATNESNTNKSFEEYRRKMHPEQEEEGRPVIPAPNKAVAIGFAILMIIVYIGMGICLYLNVFNWDSNWAWVRWFIGSVLIIYGIFRAYRSFIYHN